MSAKGCLLLLLLLLFNQYKLLWIDNLSLVDERNWNPRIHVQNHHLK